ncbi:hypothetical protein FF2_037510 [Malus domestica]
MSATTISNLEDNPTEAIQFLQGYAFGAENRKGNSSSSCGSELDMVCQDRHHNSFLGRLGELQLAGSTLGFTFANVTGFSVLNGLCAAMEPICGQAFGARNIKLLHKALLMTTFLLLLAMLPIWFLWLNVDKILIHFGQQEDISMIAKTYLFYLLPDLVVTSLLCRLANTKEAVGVLAIVLNFDYLLYSVMLSLATCASTRVSNELGANRAGPAYQSAFVSVVVSVVSGFIGGLVMLGARGSWGSLFTHDKGILGGVKKMMLLMALVEVVNFPLVVCGEIVRGTA